MDWLKNTPWLKSGSIAIYITIGLAALEALQAVPDGTPIPTVVALVLMAVVKRFNPFDNKTTPTGA